MKTLHFLFLLVAIIAVYILGLSIDVMDVDASQYASMAREMLESGNMLKVKERYENYLDKPPLIFWLASLSFKLFGISNIAYKLPSFIFSLIALYSTLRFARLYYSEQVARMSVLITGSCQAFFLFNNDCRTDTVLTGSVMLAIYHLAAYLKNAGKWHFIWGFIGIGLSMLSKGPLGLIVPAIAIGTDLVAKGQLKSIFKSEWLFGILIVVFMLTPMCWGLFAQFGIRGLKFYFWKQSFGRITGDNEFVKQLTESDYIDDPTFFYHTFLWAFLPWPILFITGLFIQLKDFIKNKFRIGLNQEIVTTAGFVMTIIIMSLSKYKLPHYIFVVFPLAGILTAKFSVNEISENIRKWMFPIHLFIMSALWILCFYLIGYSFPTDLTLNYVMYFLALCLVIYLVVNSNGNFRLLNMVLLIVIAVNFFLNVHVYPRLLKYQTTNDIGRILKEKHVLMTQVYNYTPTSHSMDFSM